MQNPFFAEIARGVEDVAYANQFAMILCISDENPTKEAFYLNVMQAESVDGVILPPIAERDAAVLKLAQSGMPNCDGGPDLARRLDRHRGGR